MSLLSYLPHPPPRCPRGPSSFPASRYRLREPESGAEPDQADLAPNFDGIWKTALQTWLPQCLALFWPAIHQRIDWTVAPVFLDKELRQIERFLKQGEKRVDLLAQVALKSGRKALLLLHLEVQAGHIGPHFPERMFHYRIRLYERHPNHALLSCAILLDGAQEQDCGVFHAGDFGDELTFRFPVVNLAAWRSRMAELEALALNNPFAVVVLAQLTCRATAPDGARLAGKLRLARQLKHWNYDETTRLVLLQLLDGLLTLPEALEEQFVDEVEEREDPEMIEQLNSFQRVRLRREKAASEEEGLKRGRVEGRVEGRLEGSAGILQAQLLHKFGPLPAWAEARIRSADTDVLQVWALKALDASHLDAVFED